MIEQRAWRQQNPAILYPMMWTFLEVIAFIVLTDVVQTNQTIIDASRKTGFNLMASPITKDVWRVKIDTI